MSIIIPANSAVGGGYAVDNSLRFNGTNDSLVRTPSSNGSFVINTWSFWVKRSNLGSDIVLFSSYVSGSNVFQIRFRSTDTLEVSYYTGAWDFQIATSRLFRDTSAFYNIVIVQNAGAGTSTDRLQVWVNGVRETSFGTTNFPALNEGSNVINSTGATQNIGYTGGSSEYFGGYMSEVVHIDGTAYAASDFGEFDEDSGIWKPIDVSGLTFGTNGSYFQFKETGTSQNSSGMGADTSGEDNHYAVNNLTAIDQSTDTCTNNFATLNPLSNTVYSVITLSEGNLKATTTAGKYAPAQSTIGFNTGKWYAEFKATDAGNWTMVGIVAQNSTASGQPLGFFSDSYGYIGGSSAGGSNSLMNNDQNTSYAATYGNGDIISIAVDCDNNKLYFGLNGTWLNSGNPESGSTGTGAAFTISATPSSGFYYFAVANYSGSQTPDWEANFGSPPYAISSGNTDGDGYGNFEYAVPSGYYALNTKNLAEYG